MTLFSEAGGVKARITHSDQVLRSLSELRATPYRGQGEEQKRTPFCWECASLMIRTPN